MIFALRGGRGSPKGTKQRIFEFDRGRRASKVYCRRPTCISHKDKTVGVGDGSFLHPVRKPIDMSRTTLSGAEWPFVNSPSPAKPPSLHCHGTVLHPATLGGTLFLHADKNRLPPIPFLAEEKEEEPFQLNRGRRKKSTCHPRITELLGRMISQCICSSSLSIW